MGNTERRTPLAASTLPSTRSLPSHLAPSLWQDGVSQSRNWSLVTGAMMLPKEPREVEIDADTSVSMCSWYRHGLEDIRKATKHYCISMNLNFKPLFDSNVAYVMMLAKLLFYLGLQTKYIKH